MINGNRIRESDSRGLVRARPAATREGAAGQLPGAYQGGVLNMDPRFANTPLLVLAYAIERMPASPEQASPEQASAETAKRVTPIRLSGWRPAPGRRTMGDAPPDRPEPAPPFRLPFAAGSRRFLDIAQQSR